MEMREFIQNEYELFCTGKLLFDLIFTESFDYLHKCGEVDLKKFKTAYGHATDYRRQVLRRHLNQDGVRATSYLPVTREDERKTERRIRVWVAKQMMVMWYYEEQQKKGVKKLFLELPASVPTFAT